MEQERERDSVLVRVSEWKRDREREGKTAVR